ncbi:MAG: DNA polymerase IV [Clostridia bacterium]|nr:DNA polymerase IV [Clostridia bacterium]
MDRIILHSDLNNFYASAEAARDPSLRGLPIAVAGDEEARHGIVLAKSYEAKKFGVSTGDTLWQAKLKCPDIKFIPPDFELYSRISHEVRRIYDRYTDRVEPFGMDECWLDVTGSERIFCPDLSGVWGAGEYIAQEIRRAVKRETGLTVSVGVSFNKIFAKLASDMKKPDAVTVVSRENFKDTVWPLPVEDLLFVGRKTEAKLKRFGISTIGRLAATEEKFLRSLLGKNGASLRQSALGLDSSAVLPVRDMPPVKSVGNGMTARRDLICDEDIKIVLYTLCESVSSRLREQGLTCRTVCVGIRDSELFTYDRQGQLPVPSRTAKALFDKAFALVKSNRPFGKGIRSLSVRATSLSGDTSPQISLFPEDDLPAPRENLESTVDRLRAKYGDTTVRRGIMLCGNSPVGADFGIDREVLYSE